MSLDKSKNKKREDSPEEREQSLINDVDLYKKGLGYGYRTSFFLCKVSFNNPLSFVTYANNLSMIQADASSPLNKFADAIGSSFNIPLRDNQFAKGFDWFGLVKSFQLPGFSIDPPKEEAMLNAVYPSGSTKGALHIGYYNDEKDVNQQFWKNYIREIGDGREFKYPDEYMCDVYFTVLDREMYPFKEYKFRRCYPISIGEDTDYKYDNKSIHDFKVTMMWQDYSMEVVSNRRRKKRSAKDGGEALYQLTSAD